VSILIGVTFRLSPPTLSFYWLLRRVRIATDCWKPLAEKLTGKGRPKKKRGHVFLPPLKTEPERPESKPAPGEPPKILCETDTLQYANSPLSLSG